MTASPIFIVGCPRSGTTLLRNLLRSHPRLTFPYESHFIPSFYRGYGHPSTDREAIALAERILGLEWIRPWKLTLQPSEFAPDRSFQAVVCRLFEAWARQEGKPRWGDKTPHGVMEIPLLVELFPSAKIIHIIRDGRDVALSWLQTGFEPHNLFTAATLWTRYVSTGRAAGAALSRETYLEIRYEALLRQPAETMRAVCAFVGEPYSDVVLQANQLPRHQRSAFFGRRVLRPAPRTEIVPSNHTKWKTEMTRSDRVLFESVAGDFLSSLAYEIEGIARPVSTVKRCAWRCHHRFWWALHRLNTRGGHLWLLTDWQLRWARMLGRSARGE